MYLCLLLLGLVSHTHTAKILGLFFYPSPVHQNVFQPIWHRLASNGHQVTVLTPSPINDPSITHLKEVSLSFVHEFAKKIAPEPSTANPYQSTIDNFEFLDAVAERVLNSTQFKEFISHQKEAYDLILLDYQHPSLYGLAELLQAPTIALASEDIPSYRYDMVGNPNHPVLYPDPVLHIDTKSISLWQKFQSFAFFWWSKCYYQYVFVPRAHQIAQKHFGDDISYIGDLERNVSLLFINMNLIMQPRRPHVPAVVDIRQTHIHPPKSLPEDLQTILDQSPQGVVFFSPMFRIEPSEVGEGLLAEVTEALSEMPYTFLLEWDTLILPFLPKNIVVKESLPQQDILAHKNVKAFVTLGDLRSVEDAISRRVPLVVIPITPEQDFNAEKIGLLQIGRKISPAAITKSAVKNVITEVVQMKKYRRKIRKVHRVLFDRPSTGLENAIWWSEYVIRHKGTAHLRVPGVDISLYKYLLVDVSLLLAFIIFAAFYVIYKILSSLLRLVFKRKTKKE